MSGWQRWQRGVVRVTERYLSWRRRRRVRRKIRQQRKNPILDWAEAIGSAILIVLLINQFLLQAYRIPSASMVPTLLVGDRIFVNKLIFGPELVPGMMKLPSPRQPRRGDLFDPHFYDYLIQLGRHREGALVSSELRRRGNLEPGDRITVNYNNQPIEAYVVGTVPYWPSLDPTHRPFVILNLDHVQDFTALEPYDSWYTVSSPEAVPHILERLPSMGVWPWTTLDTEQILADLHREPYRRGFFGILTIGFLAAAVVAVLAFVVYTIYATRQRLIQFGALRANGLSLLQTLGVVGLEQVLTVGIGLAIGIGAGNAATTLFLPFLRDRASETQPVPPFLTVTDLTDLTRLVTIVGAAFLVGVVALALFLVRARLASALRLGEEA